MTKPEDKIILVIDDEKDVIMFLQTALEDSGFNVITANDGEEALKKIKETMPDFISVDLVMPGKSGINFIQELRSNREWSRIPLIVVTGHARDEEYQQGLQQIMGENTLSGNKVYLEKPVKAHEFVSLIANELNVELELFKNGRHDVGSMKGQIDQLMKESDSDTLKDILDLLKDKE